MAQITVLPGFIDSEEAARILGITTHYLKRLRALRAIPFKKFGHWCAYLPADVEAYKREHPELGSRQKLA